MGTFYCTEYLYFNTFLSIYHLTFNTYLYISTAHLWLTYCAFT